MMNFVRSVVSVKTVPEKKTFVLTAEFATTALTWSVSAAVDARTVPSFALNVERNVRTAPRAKSVRNAASVLTVPDPTAFALPAVCAQTAV